MLIMEYQRLLSSVHILYMYALNSIWQKVLCGQLLMQTKNMISSENQLDADSGYK